jgi:hypothetical protein
MREHGSLPRAREDGLLEERVGEELLIYDKNSHTAHCLSPLAACVWWHCDGELDVTELALHVGASENVVADALHALREKDLLDDEPQPMHSTAPGISRREAISRGARYGAAAVTVPLIVSATAATPAMASSGEVAGCEPNKGTNCCTCADGECFTGTLDAAECEDFCIEAERGGSRGWAGKSKCKGD